MIKVAFNTEQVKAAAKRIQAPLNKFYTHKNFDAVRAAWASQYSAFARRRFATHSRGLGDWAPLAEGTIRARRPGRRRRKESSKPRRVAILRDTGVLFASLTVGAAGNKVQKTSKGIMFGFSNAAHNEDSATIAQIAGFHQKGGGRLPQRKILVAPDTATRVRMQRSFKALTQKRIKDAI